MSKLIDEYFYIGFSQRVLDFYANIHFPRDFRDRLSYLNGKGEIEVFPLENDEVKKGQFDSFHALVESTGFCISEDIKTILEPLNLKGLEFYRVKFEYSEREFYYLHVVNSPDFINLDKCQYVDEDDREDFPGIYSIIAIYEDKLLSIPLKERLIIKEPLCYRILFHRNIVEVLTKINSPDIGFYSIKSEYSLNPIK